MDNGRPIKKLKLDDSDEKNITDDMISLGEVDKSSSSQQEIEDLEQEMDDLMSSIEIRRDISYNKEYDIIRCEYSLKEEELSCDLLLLKKINYLRKYTLLNKYYITVKTLCCWIQRKIILPN